MISIREAIEYMHSGRVFSLKVVTFDRRRHGKSGQIREYAEAQLMWGEQEEKTREAKGERAPTALEKRLSGANTTTETDHRAPRHSDWYTRNIRILQNGLPTEMIVKIHPPLIVEFNGQTTTA